MPVRSIGAAELSDALNHSETKLFALLCDVSEGVFGAGPLKIVTYYRSKPPQLLYPQRVGWLNLDQDTSFIVHSVLVPAALLHPYPQNMEIALYLLGELNIQLGFELDRLLLTMIKRPLAKQILPYFIATPPEFAAIYQERMLTEGKARVEVLFKNADQQYLLNCHRRHVLLFEKCMGQDIGQISSYSRLWAQSQFDPQLDQMYLEIVDERLRWFAQAPSDADIQQILEPLSQQSLSLKARKRAAELLPQTVNRQRVP